MWILVLGSWTYLYGEQGFSVYVIFIQFIYPHPLGTLILTLREDYHDKTIFILNDISGSNYHRAD